MIDNKEAPMVTPITPAPLECVVRHELDRFKGETVDRAVSGRCDGACEEHSGRVKAVRVFHKESRSDWGWYSYCESAIEEDTSRGMVFEDA